MTNPTETEVSEAEVEAAAEVAYLRNRAGSTAWRDLSVRHRRDWCEKVTPILTAAAHVRGRERAPEPTKLSAAEVARVFLERERTYQGRPFDEFTVTRLEQLVLRARSDGAATALGPLPIYGATEDQGPDVLGLRKED
jgi:hypothetical protein